MTPSDRNSAEYQRPLSRESIAIACGKMNANLTGLAFSTMQGLCAFMEANSRLGETLLTHNPAQPVFTAWLRCKDYAPATTNLGDCQLLGDGEIVFMVDRPSPRECLVRPAPLVEIRFGDIRFNSSKALDLRLDYFQRRCGWPVSSGKLNLIFWASLAASKLCIVYDPAHGAFYRKDCSGARTQALPVQIVSKEVLELAQTILPKTFTSEPLNLATLVTARALEKIVDQIQITAAETLPEADDRLCWFVKNQILPVTSASVTFKEAWATYAEMCRRAGCPSIPERRFGSLFKTQVKEIFHRRPNHRVMRNDKAQRGYEHLKLINT